ncbi:hypothetical protein WMO24_06865 [Ruthenibacterium sp. CLA-JM-H11]|uniref:DUF5050 domain-containing protein n=1 Tax=Ruthenibacterium intestinale TaxID=3133163 RepID=A0ABV1GE81_9FIRM
MKRLALLLAAVLLTGCAAAPPASSDAPSAPQPISSDLLYFGLPLEGYKLAGQVSENGFFDYFSDYEKNIGFLTRYDFADMTQHILCDKDGCLHADETCDAYAPGWQVIAMSDAVYTVNYNYAEDGETFTGTQTLMRRDADGMHPTPVASIGNWNFFATDEHYLYGFCEEAYGRVDRTNGTETLLLHDGKSRYYVYGEILGVWNGQFVVIHWDENPTQGVNLSLLSPEGIETPLTQLDEISIYEGIVYPNVCALFEDKVYYVSNDGMLLCYDLSKGEHREKSSILHTCAKNSSADTWMLYALGDRLVVSAFIRPEGSKYASRHLFALSPPDGPLTELTLMEEFREHIETPAPEEGPIWEPELIQPLAQINGQFLVLNAYQFFQRPFTSSDGTTASYEDHFSIYALMDPEDYFASRPVYREFSPISNN